MSLDPEYLPAGYSSAAPAHRVGLPNGGRDVNLDLRATTLRSIEGHVFIDRNTNGRFDAGEGVANVVIRLGEGSATTTDEDGAYGFHNLVPDRHTVRVDRERLERTLTVVGGAAIDVDVTTGNGTQSGIDFALQVEDKPVRLQRILPE